MLNFSSAEVEAESPTSPKAKVLPLEKWHKKPAIIFVLGGPGAGKSTQCKRLVDRFGYVHLSAGDLLRKESSTPGSKHGELINKMIAEGAIVPAYITVCLLRQAIEEAGTHKFLIDGFPRNFENNEVFEEHMAPFVDIQCLLYFDCPEHVMEQRLMARSETSGRLDDNIDSIRKRFRTFTEQTVPVIKHYSERNKVIVVNANQSIVNVEASLSGLFQVLQDIKDQEEREGKEQIERQ